MKAVQLRFYVYESQQHEGVTLYEWLLETARTLGIKRGTASRSIASFGEHGVFHEEQFFELGSDRSVEVSFVVSEEEGDLLLNKVTKSNIETFYLKSAVESGRTGEKK